MKYLFTIAIVFGLVFTLPVRAETEEKIHVGVRPYSPPFCFLGKEDDGRVSLRGISIDFLTPLEKLLDVRFEYLSTSSVEERRTWLKEGRIDLAALVIMDDNRDHNFLYIPIDFKLKRRLFVHKSCQTVVCTRDLSGKRIAVISGITYKSYLDAVDPNNVVSVASPMEALSLLNDGMVDVFLAPSERVAFYLIQQERMQNVKAVGIPVDTMPLALAVRSERSDLYERIQEAMGTLARASIPQAIHEKWDGVPFRETFWEAHSRELLAMLAAIVAGLLGVTFWNQQLKSKVRRITQDLQTSERRYRTLIESSPDLIFVVDKDGLIHQANDKARAVFPHLNGTADQRISLLDLVQPEEKGNMTDFLNTVFTDQGAAKPFSMVGKNGRLIETDVAAGRILDKHGEHFLACCFARDVTERNSIEKELVQADRMAIIGKLSAGVAHEINNPLGIIQANVQLVLARRWYDGNAKEPLEAIRRNAVRAGNITRDLLNLAKPKEPEMAEVDLVALVRLTLSMLHPQLKGVDVECRLDGREIFVHADRNLMQQVLVNVLLNAKGSLQDAAEKRIHISFCAPPQEDTVCIRIEDTGRGIPKQYLNEVFEPFFSHGKKEGFGLGLFISRRIIERHNGMIFAESEEGKGTHIIIEMPLLKAA